MTARKPKRPPLPRAVRELLRDAVLANLNATTKDRASLELDVIAHRACRILGATPAAIVARARKVRK